MTVVSFTHKYSPILPYEHPCHKKQKKVARQFQFNDAFNAHERIKNPLHLLQLLIYLSDQVAKEYRRMMN
jgi:hypothetical protein